MPRLDIPTRALWNNMVAALTASLSAWQAARKSELDATRATVEGQGAQAANLGNIAKTNGETAVSIAQQARAEALKLAIVDPRFVSATTNNPRTPTLDEWNAEGGGNKSFIGSKLTDENTVQLLKYNGASGGWDAVGAPILARNQMDAGLDHAYATAVAALLRCPRFLSKARAGGDLTIVGIGSSSMEGVGASDPATKGFLPQLRDRLLELFPQCRIKIINRGVGGRTLAELEPEMLTYAADQADLVVITVGWNDAGSNRPTLPDFRRRYEGLCRSLMGYGSDVLAVGSQYVAYETPTHLAYSQAVQAAADAAGCGFFSRRDWMLQVMRRGKYSYSQLVIGDGLHANDLGYAAWAAAVAQALYLTSGRSERVLSHRLPIGATVYDPPLPAAPQPFDGSNLLAQTQQNQYQAIPLPANTTQRLSVSWVGTGIRWGAMMADYWPEGCTLRYRVDGGAWQPLGNPRLTTGNSRVRGGMWTLVENLPQVLHLLEMEIINGPNASGNAYHSGWEVVYTDRLGVTYSNEMVSLYGHYAFLRGPAIIAFPPDTLKTLAGEMTELLVNGSRAFLDSSYGPPSRDAVHSPGHAALPRIDAVLASQHGKLTVIEGTPDANPVAPPIRLAGVLLAHVLVPAGATNNSKFVVTDKRRIVAGVQQQVAPPALTAAPTQADMNAWRTALIAAGVWR